MKKENRQMAQERRAEERKRLELKKKRNKFLKIAVPIVLILLLVIVLIVDGIQSSDSGAVQNKSDNSVSEATVTPAPTESISLQTDASLTVEDGDTVNIDYVGKIDGTVFEGGSTDGMGTDLVIGSGSYIDDFEDQLIGSHPGDKVEVTVTFPEDYQKADFRGKEAVFDVTVNGIYR